MDGDARVARAAVDQQRLAAQHLVHEEVVFHEIQHLVRHAQRREDASFPGRVGDALREEAGQQIITPKKLNE